MRGSPYGPDTAISLFEAWVNHMVRGFPDLVLCSDVSNGDFAWLDHYRLKYLNLPSINFLKGKARYESPMDLSSYMAGLCGSSRKPVKRAMERVCQARGFQVPKILVTHTHNPIDDCVQLGLEAMYVMVQLELAIAQQQEEEVVNEEDAAPRVLTVSDKTVQTDPVEEAAKRPHQVDRGTQSEDTAAAPHTQKAAEDPPG
jgi:hypothetical protein